MLGKTLDRTSLNKLKQLVANRYGKRLEVRQLADSAIMGNLEGTLLKGGDLHIPIQMNGQLLGTAVVAEGYDIAQNDVQDLAQVVRMVLEPTLYNWFLERKENNLDQISKVQFSTENLELFGEETAASRQEKIEEEIFEASIKKSQLVSNFIHLEGSQSVLTKKVALQLHELTHRWGFVPFSDIKAQVNSGLELASLGAMTIYVEDVSTLTGEEQALLVEYVSSPRSDEEPLIITTSHLTMKDLKNSGLHAHLIDEMEINVFEVDRSPFDHRRLREVLELFFLKDKGVES